MWLISFHFVACRYIQIVVFLQEVEFPKINFREHIYSNTWLKIMPNQSEQWQHPSLENRFCFLKFFQLFMVDLSRRSIANMQKICGILIRDGVAQIDSLEGISQSKTAFWQSIVKISIDGRRFSAKATSFRQLATISTTLMCMHWKTGINWIID